MSRLIDADKAIDNINEWLDTVGYTEIGKGLSYYAELIGCIDESPTIEAEPVRPGYWVKNEIPTGVEAFGIKEMTVDGFNCSLCNGWVDVSEGNFKYCPHCGAKMDEVKE